MRQFGEVPRVLAPDPRDLSHQAPVNAALNLETRQLEAAFLTVGLTLVSPLAVPSLHPAPRRLPIPTIAGDGRTDLDTVEETRQQRDW